MNNNFYHILIGNKNIKLENKKLRDEIQRLTKIEIEKETIKEAATKKRTNWG